MANKRLGFIASLAMLPSSALCAATYVCIVKFIFYSTTVLKLLGLGRCIIQDQQFEFQTLISFLCIYCLV